VSPAHLLWASAIERPGSAVAKPGLGFMVCLATAFGIGEPGTVSMGITREMAGLGERIVSVGIICPLALAVGRNPDLGFIRQMATVVRRDEPGMGFLGFND
jgi:hypothetical protein